MCKEDKMLINICNKELQYLERLWHSTDSNIKNPQCSYHPQSNGLDERFNQTLKAQLQKIVNEHQDDWDDLLDNILFAYLTSRQASTKCTPFLLMFGREARLPINLTQVKHAKEQHKELAFSEKVEKMLDMQKSLHDQARQNIQEAQERQKHQYDAKHNSRTTLKVGDNVLLQEMKNKGRKGGKSSLEGHIPLQKF